jgi:hypothetical protein
MVHLTHFNPFFLPHENYRYIPCTKAWLSDKKIHQLSYLGGPIWFRIVSPRAWYLQHNNRRFCEGANGLQRSSGEDPYWWRMMKDSCRNLENDLHLIHLEEHVCGYYFTIGWWHLIIDMVKKINLWIFDFDALENLQRLGTGDVVRGDYGSEGCKNAVFLRVFLVTHLSLLQ